MSIKLEKLDQENWDSLHRMATCIYLDGQCYEFAVALHRGLGWKMVGLITGSVVGPVIRHVLVESPDGKLWDVRGVVPLAEIGKPFNVDKVALEYVMTEEKLKAVRPISEEAIERASLVAEALWPELLWRTNTFQGRALWFMSDLESLCRRHGVWIRAPYPVAQIVLGKAYGDEEGFRISPTMDGQYFFDRVL